MQLQISLLMIVGYIFAVIRLQRAGAGRVRLLPQPHGKRCYSRERLKRLHGKRIFVRHRWLCAPATNSICFVRASTKAVPSGAAFVVCAHVWLATWIGTMADFGRESIRARDRKEAGEVSRHVDPQLGVARLRNNLLIGDRKLSADSTCSP